MRLLGSSRELLIEYLPKFCFDKKINPIVLVFFFSLDPFLRKIIDYIPDLLKTFPDIVSKYKNNIVSFIQKIKHQIRTSSRKHRKLPKKELRQVK